jgi:hypothetical protein
MLLFQPGNLFNPLLTSPLLRRRDWLPSPSVGEGPGVRALKNRYFRFPGRDNQAAHPHFIIVVETRFD